MSRSVELHEGERSTILICQTSPGHIRKCHNADDIKCRNDGQDASVNGTASGIFSKPLLIRPDNGRDGARYRRSLPLVDAVHIIITSC